jgi:hypothetical protein
MTKTKTEPTKQILAIGQDGNRYQIIEYTTFIADSEFGAPIVWEPSNKRYKLYNGVMVNKRSDTEFEAMFPGGIIKLSVLT